MARRYSVIFEGVAVTAAQDFFYIAPADDRPVRLVSLFLSQSSDYGDAAAEGLRIKVIRGHATVGSGGSAFTPTPNSANDVAAGFTARINDTTIASAGTAVDVHADAFNIQAGIGINLEGHDIRCSQATGVTLVVRLMAAPSDSLTMSGTLVVEELI